MRLLETVIIAAHSLVRRSTAHEFLPHQSFHFLGEPQSKSRRSALPLFYHEIDEMRHWLLTNGCSEDYTLKVTDLGLDRSGLHPLIRPLNTLKQRDDEDQRLTEQSLDVNNRDDDSLDVKGLNDENQDEEKFLMVVDLRPRNEHAKFADLAAATLSLRPVFKVMVVAGIHPRELITSELAFSLIKDHLCAETPALLSPSKLFHFRFILNACPSQRRRVEEGSFCTRTNFNAVDINRNFEAALAADRDEDQEAMKSSESSQTFPGPAPFSERESRLLRLALETFKPDLLFDFHSGSFALLTPPASLKRGQDLLPLSAPSLSRESMNEPYVDREKELRQELVKYAPRGVPYGTVAEFFEQSLPGSFLDWATEVFGTRFGYVFEIFAEKAGVRRANRARVSAAGEGVLFPEAESSLPFSEKDQCFREFNPREFGQYRRTLDLWAPVFLQLVVARASADDVTEHTQDLEPSDPASLQEQEAHRQQYADKSSQGL